MSEAPKEFVYLLNAMERAAQEENPAAHGYAAKRRAVLDYVAAPRLRVPVPPNMVDPSWPDCPKDVDVADVLARRNRDRVYWYEIAALCEALLRRLPPTERSEPDA